MVLVSESILLVINKDTSYNISFMWLSLYTSNGKHNLNDLVNAKLGNRYTIIESNGLINNSNSIINRHIIIRMNDNCNSKLV